MDGPQYGMSPAPWDIPVSLPQRYTDKVEKIRVPHSSFVKVLLCASLVFFQLPELLSSLFNHSNTNLCSRCVTSAKAAGELAAPPASAEARSGF